MDNSPPEQQRVQFELAHDEALVLFELLADLGDQASLSIPSTAERLALRRLFGALESALVEPLYPDYANLLKAARGSLSEQYGSE